MLDVSMIEGFLLPDEADLLYTLASKVPPLGVIVELGSYQGKSTVALGRGALKAGAVVWAVDGYVGRMEGSQYEFGMDNHAALLRNLLTYNLGNVVRVVALTSEHAACGWTLPIDLLFIDAGHDYASVSADLANWTPHLRGKLVMHDTSGDWPGVSSAVDELLAVGDWERTMCIETISVFEKVGK